METPSSKTKRVTRSMTLAALNSATAASGNNSIPLSRNVEDSDKGISKSRRIRKNQKQQQEQEDRSALIDITNDSPIVGLAMGSLKTPLSSMTKRRSLKAKINSNSTPCSGSGEALLRCQVKTLLQKVEEGAKLSKLSMENRPFLHLQGFVSSPSGLVAPTPANTPQLPYVSADGGVNDVLSGLMAPSLPVVDEQIMIRCQVVADEEETLESQKSISRSLLLDFSEKSENSDSSTITTYDDNASNWSIQANASTHDEGGEEEEEEEEEAEEEEKEYDYDDDYEGESGDNDEGGLEIEELCEGIGNVCMNEKQNVMPRFEGKHTRFVYDSDDNEIVGLEDDCALRLKGLPTPRGKHVRFQMEDDDEED